VVLVAALSGLLALGVVGFGAGVWGIARGVAQDKARSDLVISEMQRKAQEKTDEFNRKEREREQQWTRDSVRAAEARAASLARAASIEAELRRTRTDRDGLRDRLAAYAAGPANPSDDTLTACRERSRRLGERLDAGLSVQEQLGGFVAACAATVRSLRDAWPRNKPAEEVAPANIAGTQ
jgi:hypothetical protein